jgi:hypothetical protein
LTGKTPVVDRFALLRSRSEGEGFLCLPSPSGKARTCEATVNLIILKIFVNTHLETVYSSE